MKKLQVITIGTKPIKKLLVLLISQILTLSASSNESRGIDGIGVHGEYLNLEQGKVSYYCSGNWWADRGTCSYQLFGRGTRSFIDDIKGAILDRDHFDAALAENRFFDAWSMGGDTEQGHLWKKLAISQTKKHLSQLVNKSVFENNPDKMAQARAISGLFPEVVASELVSFIEAENTSTQEVFRNLVPDAAARLTALRTIADKLFG